jgi:hypothetical protein
MTRTGEPKDSAIAADSSVDPSSTTITSSTGRVCASTEASVSRRNRAPL